jgi:hypothetical protein
MLQHDLLLVFRNLLFEGITPYVDRDVRISSRVDIVPPSPRYKQTLSLFHLDYLYRTKISLLVAKLRKLGMISIFIENLFAPQIKFMHPNS